MDKAMECVDSSQPQAQQKVPWCEGKQVAVHEEIERMNRLPVDGSYSSHDLRLFKKILQLMSMQKTAAEDEELELLFAGLSL